jgi:AcrR family transcriptional regulator
VASRLSIDERRAHLIEAAIGLAERKGVAGVTTRDVAQAAGVSLGVVHYCFDSKDALMIELVKALSIELRDSVEDDPRLRGDPGTGVDALRELLHASLAAMWSQIEAGRDRQLLTYETTTYALREAGQTPTKLRIARDQYDFNDETVAEVLERIRQPTETAWTVPVRTVSRFLLAMIDGVVLRWLVDDDSATAREQLALAVEMVIAVAVATE